MWLGSPGGSEGKESTCNAGDLDSTPELERSPGGGHGNPFQYSGESPLTEASGYSSWDHKELDMTEQLSTIMWLVLLKTSPHAEAILGTMKSPLQHKFMYDWKGLLWLTWRRQWHPTPVFLPGKSHGWRSLVGWSPWCCEESDTTERLHFHFWLFMHWRRKWQLTPMFLPGESQGRGSLVGCRLCGCTESDMTEVI